MSKGTSRDTAIRDCMGHRVWIETYSDGVWLRQSTPDGARDVIELIPSSRADLIRALGGVAKSEVTPEMVDALTFAHALSFREMERRGPEHERALIALKNLLTEDTNA